MTRFLGLRLLGLRIFCLFAQAIIVFLVGGMLLLALSALLYVAVVVAAIILG